MLSSQETFLNTQTQSAQEAPTNEAQLLARLDDIFDELPKRLKQCAGFTRLHLHLIAVSTVSDMARACDVSPSVYVRFCQALGFSGYSEMQAVFRARFTGGAGAVHPETERARPGAGGILSDLAASGHNALIRMQNKEFDAQLDRVTHALAGARVVHLAGLSRGYGVVSNLAYMFDKLGVPAMLHGGAGMVNSATSIFDGDVLLAATFEPFADETIAFAKGVAERGIAVFGLTDHVACPLGDFASELIVASEDKVSGHCGLGAAFTVTSALALAVETLRQRG